MVVTRSGALICCRLHGVELLLEQKSTSLNESFERTARTLRNDLSVRNIVEPNPFSSPGKRLTGRTLSTGKRASTVPSFLRSLRGSNVLWWMLRSICESLALSASGTMKGASSPGGSAASRACATLMKSFIRADWAWKYLVLKSSEYLVAV